MRTIDGLDRVTAYLTEKIYEAMQKYNYLENAPIEDYERSSKALDNCSIGQLYTLAMLGDRWNGLKIHSYDDDTIYLTISGLYGGMDKDGFIHT